MTMGSKLDATWSKANKYQYFILNKNLLTKFDFPISHSILHSLSFFQIKKTQKKSKITHGKNFLVGRLLSVIVYTKYYTLDYHIFKKK